MSATTRFTLGTAGLACLLATASVSLGANASGTLTFNSYSTGQKIDTVTPSHVQTLAQQLFRPDAIAVTVLGNLGDLQITRDDLAC